MPFSRILVTGGCGFLGSHLLEQLHCRWPAARLVNLDALTYAGSPLNVAALADCSQYRFVQGRVEDQDALRQLLQEEAIEAIFHLAAESHVDRSISGPQPFITTNVVGTQVVLDGALTCGVRRVIYASTDEVYGPAIPGAPVDEQAPLRPTSPYAASKAAGDLLVQAYSRTYDLDAIITRGCNAYGPRQHPEKLVPLATINALERRPIPIYGDGRQQRDWLHVADHCQALIGLLLSGSTGGIYNIAGGQPQSNLTLVERILTNLGRERSLLWHVKDRPAHDRRYACSAARLQQELGWRPTIDLDAGLRQTVAWYVDNPAWREDRLGADFQDYYRRQYGVERS